MKKAYIISTGTELLLGTTVDTNSMFLARKLAELGLKVMGKSIVGDNRDTIAAAFKTGLEMADLVVASGGLGPTRDDLTKEVVCELLGCELQVVEEELEAIKAFFSKRNRKMAESNRKQAMFPPEAKILKNRLGTAPGMYLAKDGKIVILLPGPPREMQDMYLAAAEPLLGQEEGLMGSSGQTRIMRVLGPGESQVEDLLGEILDKQQDYGIALLAQEGEVIIKITVDGPDPVEAGRRLEELCRSIEAALGSNVVCVGEDTLAGVVAKLLTRQGLFMAAVESCSGGLLSKMITDLPGSSNFFWGSVVSYSNQAKQVLVGVKEDTLQAYGAVSRETAAEMVVGIKNLSGVDVAVSITGIAGPDGGSDEKPVGLVYIGLALKGTVEVKEMRFVGDRSGIRTLAAKSALDLVRRRLLTEEGAK
ncbi:MAG TPA: competence/damage-inducible protein A [Syntrophomonas sp.]|mgnify:CR=1 FL=1|jgi:nicotinamide-nucleotide amidase|nr:competence/damage-inducible protein A [Syntrophomonas sp.]